VIANHLLCFHILDTLQSHMMLLQVLWYVVICWLIRRSSAGLIYSDVWNQLFWVYNDVCTTVLVSLSLLLSWHSWFEQLVFAIDRNPLARQMPGVDGYWSSMGRRKKKEEKQSTAPKKRTTSGQLMTARWGRHPRWIATATLGRSVRLFCWTWFSRWLSAWHRHTYRIVLTLLKVWS
jgi:hypothetical protein